MKKTQLPSKREIVPTSTDAAAKARTVFTDDFKRKAVLRMRAGGQTVTDLARRFDRQAARKQVSLARSSNFAGIWPTLVRSWPS